MPFIVMDFTFFCLSIFIYLSHTEREISMATHKDKTLSVGTLSMKDGWMTCNFTSLSKVFQSYQDDGQMIMKSCVNGTPFMAEKILPLAGLEPGTARSVGQGLTH